MSAGRGHLAAMVRQQRARGGLHARPPGAFPSASNSRFQQMRHATSLAGPGMEALRRMASVPQFGQQAVAGRAAGRQQRGRSYQSRFVGHPLDD